MVQMWAADLQVINSRASCKACSQPPFPHLEGLGLKFKNKKPSYTAARISLQLHNCPPLQGSSGLELEPLLGLITGCRGKMWF